MAEGFLRELAGDRYDAYSAGLEATEVHPLAVVAMRERGIDISGQRSKNLHEYLGREHFGILVTVCDQAEEQCPIFPGVSTREHWPFEDPALAEGSDEERLAKFREVRDAIEARVKEWLRQRSEAPASLTHHCH
jgi:arsenate reductase